MEAPLKSITTEPGKADTITTFQALGSTGILIIDFWTTACPNCPAAITKLHNFALTNNDPKIKCISVCLGREEPKAQIIVEEGEWTALEHYYGGDQSREAILGLWTFDRVPRLVIIENGVTKYEGPPKPIAELLAKL